MKRKLKKSVLFSIIFIVGIVFLSLFILFIFKDKDELDVKYDVVRTIDYSSIDEFDFDLYSKAYLLIRLNDFKALYGDNYNDLIYPASLTKVLTMNTLLNRFDNLDDTSYITTEQYYYLISENASLGGLMPEKEYSLKDLLYLLILPSGGDAALAIENYFAKNGLNLIDEMNKRCDELGLIKSHFTNPTGLHDENLYTSLKDLSFIYMDTLNYKIAKDILKTTYSSDYDIYSTLYSLSVRDDSIQVFGGKTGFTNEAHHNAIIFYEYGNRSYMLMIAGARGDDDRKNYHFMDINNIFNNLYN